MLLAYSSQRLSSFWVMFSKPTFGQRTTWLPIASRNNSLSMLALIEGSPAFSIPHSRSPLGKRLVIPNPQSQFVLAELLVAIANTNLGMSFTVSNQQIENLQKWHLIQF
ncbi:MAG: hypothetical protein ACFBSF_15610 [Leptolyngbyaceae cyanobacterium]